MTCPRPPSYEVSMVSDPWVLDPMLQMPCDDEHPLERWVAPVLGHGRGAGREKVAADHRDGIMAAGFLPTPGGCLSGGFGVRHGCGFWEGLPGPTAWGLVS